MPMYGFGWRNDLERHDLLVATQAPFGGSRFMAAKIPNEIDPRGKLTVKNQGQLGSCSGFSRSTLEELLNLIAGGGPATFSAMFCYLENQKACDCFGADNGATISGSIQAATTTGVCHESLFPYTGRYSTTIPPEAESEGRLHLVKSHSVLSSVDEARQYLGTAGVIQIGIPVGSRFQNCPGVLTTRDAQADARNPDGGHALAIVGYLSNGNFLLQNSWSEEWGKGGYCEVQPQAWDYWCQSGGQNVEIIGMSGLAGFDNASDVIDWSQTYA